MKCPVSCWSCGDLCELDGSHFNTGLCGCVDGCSHGICDECFAKVNQPDPSVTFKFVEFNPRRHSRGVEAARVEVLEDGEPCGLLWMSERDIRKNIAEFGDSEELQKALEEYRKHRRR